MKKLLRNALLCGIMTICALLAVACSAPAPDLKSNINDVKALLEERGYSVEIVSAEEGESEPVSVAMEKGLAAYKSGELKLTIAYYNDSATAKKYHQAMKFSSDNMLKEYEIMIDLYEHVLNKYEDELLNSDIIEMNDTIKEYNKVMEEAEEIVFGRKGSIVWYGTKEAIEDTKK